MTGTGGVRRKVPLSGGAAGQPVRHPHRVPTRSALHSSRSLRMYRVNDLADTRNTYDAEHRIVSRR